ncbi:hypothetical protein [Streptosporangium longisporum]|uniref:DUF998 domain-containing protein n=1 Tax=Streptosporangium longisporum TaxID=46187 RepID=A0ABN3XQR9_9ACTN
MTRNLRIAGALLSIAVTAVGLWWWTTPASYPFGALDRVTVSLSHLFEHDVGGPMTVVAGLAGLVTAFTSGVALKAGAVAQVLFFGVVMSDAGIMSLLGYGMALIGPLALVAVLVMACARRGRARVPALVVLVSLLVLVAGGTLTGLVPFDRLLANLAASFSSYAGRVAWTLADALACALWAVVAVAAFRAGGTPRWARPEAAARWGRPVTIAAALCPLPYALYRLTWLTPWPTDIGAAELAANPGLRMQGLAIGFGALGGSLLTLGLIAGWGEVWPRWVPVLHGRPVPVRLPVTAGGLVAGACCLASPGLTVNAVQWGQPLLLLLWPYPVWGVLLAAAVLAYRLRRGAGTAPEHPAPITRATRATAGPWGTSARSPASSDHRGR